MQKILVVDDESVIRELLSDILSSEGYQVETSPHGKSALDKLRKDDGFVLLFTDIMMPEMDGITLIREARTVRPAIIPIVMTGFATIETARAAVKEGAYDYVLKPFSLSEIKLAVKNAFDRHRLEAENTRLREVTSLFNISETIAGIRNEKALLNYILQAALERVYAKRGSLMTVSEDGECLEIAASVGIPEKVLEQPISLERGISGKVAAQGRPLLVDDIENNPELILMSRRLNHGSFISVPLERKHPNGGMNGKALHQSRVLAVLNVTEKANGQSFNEGDLKILSIMANHAAAAIENVRLIRDLETAHLSTLQSMARLLEAKDAYTHGHSERVRDYSVMVGQKLGMAQADLDTLHLGAMLHDIGKVGVQDSVLNKVDRLEQDEWEMIKQHPVIGYNILRPVHNLTEEHLTLVRSHHERLDGSGYPDGLKGEALSDIVRIIGVADSYDAMASSRAYRPGMPAGKILEELTLSYQTGKLDPKITKTFIELIESGEVHHASKLSTVH